jgi:hypothetical protein
MNASTIAKSAGQWIRVGYVVGSHRVSANPGGANHCRGAACVAYIQL